MKNPFCYVETSPAGIRTSVMMCVRFPLSRRPVENFLSEQGIDISPETARFWSNRFGPGESDHYGSAALAWRHDEWLA